MSKYSRELKIMIAKRCLAGNASDKLSAEYSISSRQIRYWSQVVAIHGDNAFLPTPHSLCATTKLHALKLMWTNDWSLTHTSAVLNLTTPGTLSVWLDKYNETGIKGLESPQRGRPPMKSRPKIPPKSDDEMTVEELKEELAYLRAENAVLKKLEGLEQKKRQRAKKKR
ncbi:helix-turn-helix domain-containing protein [Xenorhabdus bovienii]|nr:helix-turn-helix domain-containing protein [Xenorhabdus bovienii]MDE9448117.1 helix-turn-helix domain-containing protein [Xenorhabdus bovienii]MDE9484261.1 helix-turn-helix domain-containing protein [Xenorhabdus bovienii]